MPKSNRQKNPLTPTNIDNMPRDKSGVYGFWYRINGRCIYIGKTESRNESIRHRVRRHWVNSHNPGLKQWIKSYGKFLEVCYIPIERSKIGQVDKLETRLIRLWNPETNDKKKRK